MLDGAEKIFDELSVFVCIICCFYRV